MSTLVDNLISTLQNKIACGETDARIEPEVLAEFMSDFSAPQRKPEPQPESVKAVQTRSENPQVKEPVLTENTATNFMS